MEWTSIFTVLLLNLGLLSLMSVTRTVTTPAAFLMSGPTPLWSAAITFSWGGRAGRREGRGGEGEREGEGREGEGEREEGVGGRGKGGREGRREGGREG